MVAAMEVNTDMEIDNHQPNPNVDDIFSENADKCQRAVSHLKSILIGSNKQKRAIVEQGVIPRLITLLSDDSINQELKVNVAFTLGSVAKGTESQLKALIDSDIVRELIKCVKEGMKEENLKLVEACLSCLKTVFQHSEAPVDLIFADSTLVPDLIRLMHISSSTQICISSIFTSSCKKREHQDLLAGHGLVTALNALLNSAHPDIHLPALHCLAYLVIGNDKVANLVGSSTYENHSLLHQVVRLMDRYRKIEVQFAAAKVVTYLYRCGVLSDSDPIIIYKALPCVVRMTRPEESVENRVLAAETLAYLIEANDELQRVAAISNHLIPNVASFLSVELDAQNGNDIINSNILVSGNSDLKRAAFRVFASLGANDEDIRKRIIEIDNLMPSLVSALKDSSDPKLQMAAIGCLHSLSRSVQLLRTTFQDHPMCEPLMKLLNSSPIELRIVASSTLCNLLLEFSPSKEPILKKGAIEKLCKLTYDAEPALRLNAVWGLMNVAFQAEERIKEEILNSLEPDQIFRLLSDKDINVVMKTLGLLRNLLSNKLHIDHIMSSYGKQIMQAVVLILESDNLPEVKEQALCILANIADGDSAKQFIMSNEDVLKKVTSYLMHNNSKLQIAAVLCVQNLTWAGEDGSSDRQAKLKDIGVFRILQGMLNTQDTALFEKVKGALQQFA